MGGAIKHSCRKRDRGSNRDCCKRGGGLKRDCRKRERGRECPQQLPAELSSCRDSRTGHAPHPRRNPQLRYPQSCLPLPPPPPVHSFPRPQPRPLPSRPLPQLPPSPPLPSRWSLLSRLPRAPPTPARLPAAPRPRPLLPPPLFPLPAAGPLGPPRPLCRSSARGGRVPPAAVAAASLRSPAAPGSAVPSTPGAAALAPASPPARVGSPAPPPPAFKRSQHAPRGPRAGHTPMVNPVPAAVPPAQSPGPGTALLALGPGHPSPFSCRRRGTLHRWPQPVPCLPRLRLNFPPAPPLPAGPAATPARLTSSRRLHAALQPPTSPRLAMAPPQLPPAAPTPLLPPPPRRVYLPLTSPPRRRPWSLSRSCRRRSTPRPRAGPQLWYSLPAPSRCKCVSYQLQEHGDSKDLKSQDADNHSRPRGFVFLRAYMSILR
ncbi:uncharacterized protein LOC135451861 [Zonotrichia leucophrys gambelii]|uniref:uncharacterized protein LOC135451861 n=1 Tax=Zonotrichia leucophrys gambelii TaxID=257770 RepID=UPI0031407CDF